MRNVFGKKLAILVVLTILIGFSSPILAADTSSLPECQFSGPPSAEQLAACEAAAKAQASSGQSSSSSLDQSSNTSVTPPNIPTDMPGTAGAPDLSRLTANLPQVPSFDGNGPAPSFMGQELAGNDAMDQAAAQIGNALSQVRDGLLKAEEGVKEFKDGKVKVGDMEETVKQARSLYGLAKAAFESKDYAGAGQYLQKIQALDMQSKFSGLESKGISEDLINDIRKEMKNALKNMSNFKEQDSEMNEMKAKLMASLEKLDQAQACLKKGNKQAAAKIMKELRDSAPQDEAQGTVGNFKNMPHKMMGKILKKIADGLRRGEKGMNKAKASGIEADPAAIALMEQAKKIYDEAQTLYDKEDYSGASAKLREMEELNLEERFTAFKKSMMPADRMKTLLTSVADGVKALELTIEHTKTAGYATTELEALLAKVKGIYTGAGEAVKIDDTETFLTYLDQMDALNISDQVDATIKKLANDEIKDLVAEGIAKFKNVVAALEEAITKLKAKKIDTDNATDVLNSLKAEVANSQEKYDAGDYMNAGKFLDKAMDNLVSLINITRDSGVSLAAERMKEINDVLALSKADSGQLVVNPDKIGQLDQIFATVGNDEAMEMKQAFMQFDPALMDKVVAQRQKDKKYMDAILRDVMPLIPAADREKVLEGKTGLLEEMAATDKTIANIKRIKGVTADTSKALDKIKNQIKEYNFSPEVAAALEEKMANFNDKIQTGEIKDPKMISNYIKVLQEETAKAIKESLTKKFKQGIVPAKNIDDNNPLFDELQQLKNDGAIKPDAKGNIDLGKKMTGKEVADMINKTNDKKAVAKAPSTIMTISDVGNMVFNAYDVKPNIDTKKPDQMAKFLKQIGADVNAANMNKKATLKEVADIVAAADDRWGKAD